MSQPGLSPETPSRKKRAMQIFGRKKALQNDEQERAPIDDPNLREDDHSDSDSEPGLGAMAAPGQIYNTKKRETQDDDSRGRGLFRRGSKRGDKSRSRSRSRSISGAFKRLVSGRNLGADEERSVSRRGGRRRPTKDETAETSDQFESPPIPRTIEAYHDPSRVPKETPRTQNRKKGSKDDPSVNDSINTEIDDLSQGLLSAGRKKKKATKKKKDRGDYEDENSSRVSLKKKKSSRKKSLPQEREGDDDPSSPGSLVRKKKSTKKKTSDNDSHTLSKKKSRRKKNHEGDREWEAEEYLISPPPRKKKTSFNDSFGDIDASNARKSMLSIQSDMSSIRRSVGGDDEDSVVESQALENKKLKETLAKMSMKLAETEDVLRQKEIDNNKVRHELNDVRREMTSVAEQNTRLHKSMDAVEIELSTKEDRIEALEDVVEQQLDSVEELEKRLDETEDELFRMEEELKVLEAKENLDESVHTQGRLQRMNSIRFSRVERQESKRDLTRAGSVRDLINNSMDKSTHNRRASMLSSRERKLAEKERQMEVDRERDESREKRLEEWENDLNEKERLIKGASIDSRLQNIEAREKELEEHELSQKRRKDRPIMHVDMENLSASQKDQMIIDLKAECEDLLLEKEDIVRRFDEEDTQREKDLLVIQEEINEKMRLLERENRDLLERVEEAEEQKHIIKDLETEVSILQKSGGAGGEGDEKIRELQEEVAQQLSELDTENRKLTSRLETEARNFEEKLNEKELLIIELEEMLEEREKGKTDRNEDQEDSSVDSVSSELASALQESNEKQAEIDLLRKKLGQVAMDFEERNTREMESKDNKIQQLEDELLATRAVIEAKTSDQLSMQMKSEIKQMKEIIKDLNDRIKADQQSWKLRLQKKEDSLKNVQREVLKLQREIERRNEREKQKEGRKVSVGEGDAKHHIEDLEEEIEHWKSVNCELEDEVVHWKTEASSLKNQLEEAEELDDNASTGSPTSELSKKPAVTKTDALDLSLHSFSSLSKEDLFFVPKRSSGSSVTSQEDNSSQRAMRTVTDLWSRMTQKQPPAPSTGLYQMSLDD